MADALAWSASETHAAGKAKFQISSVRELDPSHYFNHIISTRHRHGSVRPSPIGDLLRRHIRPNPQQERLIHLRVPYCQQSLNLPTRQPQGAAFLSSTVVLFSVHETVARNTVFDLFCSTRTVEHVLHSIGLASKRITPGAGEREGSIEGFKQAERGALWDAFSDGDGVNEGHLGFVDGTTDGGNRGIFRHD